MLKLPFHKWSDCVAPTYRYIDSYYYTTDPKLYTHTHTVPEQSVFLVSSFSDWFTTCFSVSLFPPTFKPKSTLDVPGHTLLLIL